MERRVTEELNIRSHSVTAAAKLLKVAPKTVLAHIRRGLPLVDPALPCGRSWAANFLVLRRWKNAQTVRF